MLSTTEAMAIGSSRLFSNRAREPLRCKARASLHALHGASCTLGPMTNPAPRRTAARAGARRRLAALVAIPLVIAGCVTDSRPSACDQSAITIDLQLTADALTPGDPAVCRDQDVTLVVTSKVDGV